jgi:transposase-like protein
LGLREAEQITDFVSQRIQDIHWQKIRTNNPLERIMKEIRRRTRVVGAFRTVSPVSIWRPLDYGTSPERRGPPNAT